MGHTPNSLTLKKSYAGRFERVDMNRLVATGEAVEGATIDPLLSPAMFQVKDITRYYLTDQEIEENINSDHGVINLFDERQQFKDELQKKYGRSKQSAWKKKT
jgi:hypothetical protein